MDIELKQKWIDALKSGEYKQGFHYLNYGGCQCVLGVLLLVADIAPSGKAGKVIEYDRLAHSLSTRIRTELGISRHTVYNLSSLNDGGSTFEVLAPFIESMKLN